MAYMHFFAILWMTGDAELLLNGVNKVKLWKNRKVGRWVGNFFGQVISPHHPDQMSERSQVFADALWRSRDADRV